MSQRSLANKRVLLTGASSGIGWYLASELVRAGAYVVVTSRREDRLQKLRQSFGNPRRRLIAVPGDIADAGHREKLVDTAVRELGGIDLVFNNAGVGAIGAFEDASQDRLRRIFEVDFLWRDGTDAARASALAQRDQSSDLYRQFSACASRRAGQKRILRSEVCAARLD